MWSKHLLQHVLKHSQVTYNTQNNVNPNSVVIKMCYLGNDNQDKNMTVQMQFFLIEIY